MKGFILNDFYSMKKMFFSSVRGLLIFFAIGIIILMGIKYGNISKIDEGGFIANWIIALFDNLFPLAAGMFAYSFPDMCFEIDKKSGWNKYLFSLPGTNAQKVGARYIILTAITAAMCVFVTAETAAFHAAAGDLSSGVFNKPLVFYCAVTAFGFIMTCILYVVQDKRKMVALWFGLWIVLCVIGTTLMKSIGEDNVQKRVVDLLNSRLALDNLWLFAVILIAAIAASFAVSVQAVKRREKLC